MKRLIILLLTLTPFISSAQKLQIYTDEATGYHYLALYAYGLPREIVKTNQEIKDSKFGDTGIMRRHHTTKYDDAAIGDEGYNSNKDLSFAFLIAPYNITAQGVELKENDWQATTSWYEASGWDETTDTKIIPDPWGEPAVTNVIKNDAIANPTPTGCAAYRGPTGEDPLGSWRLPTQREALVMFTIMEQALTMKNAHLVTNHIINGEYWTSTELYTSSYWKTWVIDTGLGAIVHVEKILAGGTRSQAFARCVRDIDNDPINE